MLGFGVGLQRQGCQRPVSHTLSHVALDPIILSITWVSRKGKNRSISPVSVLQKKKKKKKKKKQGRGVGVEGLGGGGGGGGAGVRVKGLKVQPSGFSVCM